MVLLARTNMRCGSGGSERVGEGGVLGSPREAEAAGGECAELQRLSPPISVFCCPATPRTKAKSRYVSLSLFNSISFSRCPFVSFSHTHSLSHSFTHSQTLTQTHTQTLSVCLHSSLLLPHSPDMALFPIPHPIPPPPHPTPLLHKPVS